MKGQGKNVQVILDSQPFAQRLCKVTTTVQKWQPPHHHSNRIKILMLGNQLCIYNSCSIAWSCDHHLQPFQLAFDKQNHWGKPDSLNNCVIRLTTVVIHLTNFGGESHKINHLTTTLLSYGNYDPNCGHNLRATCKSFWKIAEI